MIIRHAVNFATTLLAVTIMPNTLAADEVGLNFVERLLNAGEYSSAYAVEFGQVADTNIYYGKLCTASHFGRLVLLQMADGGAQNVYEKNESCVSSVGWRDIDGDGRSEIRVIELGGGSGYHAANAVFMRWDEGADAPEEIVSFITYSYSSWGGVYGEYGFEPEKWFPFTSYENNFLPIGAQCPNEDACELITRTTFCIESCSMELPTVLTQDPHWPAFVAALAADGMVPGNMEPFEEDPGVSPEAQAALDAWLTQ